MVSITLSVPVEIRKRMNLFPDINWSGFIRQQITERIHELSWKKEMLKKLKEEEPLTEWAVELQRKGRQKRYSDLVKRGVFL